MTKSLLACISDLSSEPSSLLVESELVSISSDKSFVLYSSNDLSCVLVVPVDEVKGLQFVFCLNTARKIMTLKIRCHLLLHSSQCVDHNAV